MRDYDAIIADAKERTPFSNGTSGEIWMSGWCYTPCAHDAAFQRDEAPLGCPLLLAAFSGYTPKEWTETGLQDYHCSEFRPEDDGDGDDAPLTPVPVCDGQLDILGVFADQITEQASRELVTA